MLCFNAHMPTPIATEKRKETCVLQMCEFATVGARSGVPHPTASMTWRIAGDLNIAKGTMMQWCQPYVEPNVECISDSGWPLDIDAQKADFALSQGISLKHVQAWVGRHSMPCASDAHDAVVVMGSLDLQHLHRQDRPSAWKRAIITLCLWFLGRCCCCCRY